MGRVFFKVKIEKLVVNFERFVIKGAGNILVIENQRVIINDVIEVKMGVYLHKLKQI